jgi:C4-dicarboxylate transporter, DctM subunit
VIWLIIALLVVLALMGAPFFALVAAVAMLGFYFADTSLVIVVQEFARIGEMPVLVAIPLFTLAGYLLGESKAPQRLVRLTNALIGWLPGGLAIVSLLACALFTAFTGASGVTIVALGAVLYPALTHAGYKENFTLGLITTSGSLGMLFAPALPLIIYAVVAQQLNTQPGVSIDDLFKAGVLPGLLMIVMLAVYAMLRAPVRDKALPAFDGKELRAALKDSAWEIPLPIVVVLGIYLGWFPPSDAAAVTALYVLIVVMLVRREVTFKDLPRVIRESMVLVGAMLLILGMALALTNYLIDNDVPNQLFEFLNAHIHNRWIFMLALNIFLLVFGMLLEGFPAIVILTPLILPIAMQYGMHPVHFGIVFLANLQIGLFLPPVGMNLFIASFRFNRPVAQLIRASWPFFLILLVAVLIITYWPWLSLALLDQGTNLIDAASVSGG